MHTVAEMGSRVRRFVQFALSAEGAGPSDTSELILKHLSRETATAETKESILQFSQQRGITTLIHFTPLSNVASILRFGLIPREYLKYRTVALALAPVFSDAIRSDGREHSNCISVTFPNYRMLYSKWSRRKEQFAVLELSVEAMFRHACYFSDTNAARPNAKIEKGIAGARQMFGQEALRSQLNLPKNYTTDPESEILNESVVPPSWVHRVLVQDQKDQIWLESRLRKQGVRGVSCVEVDKAYFRPRHDYSHWQRALRGA